MGFRKCKLFEKNTLLIKVFKKGATLYRRWSEEEFFNSKKQPSPFRNENAQRASERARERREGKRNVNANEKKQTIQRRWKENVKILILIIKNVQLRLCINRTCFSVLIFDYYMKFF